MPQILPRPKRMAFALAGSAALVLGLAAVSETARAMPLVTAGSQAHTSIVEPARIYRRGRTPIYPYYYNPGRPGGYSFYFGFVPYEKGDYETQAIQRMFPEANYPPSMRYWTPRSGF